MSTTTVLKPIATPVEDTSGIPAHLREYQAQMRDSFFALATPLNIALVVLLLTVIYFQYIRTTEPSYKLPDGAPPVVFQTFTPRTLLKKNGVDGAPVFMAVKGKVYDVTSGRNFYGPGGPYENFAGRDATRGLACQSFDEDMLTKNLDGPLDDCKDLNAEQIENLNGWVERFDEKYLIVGKLKAFFETAFH